MTSHDQQVSSQFLHHLTDHISGVPNRNLHLHLYLITIVTEEFNFMREAITTRNRACYFRLQSYSSSVVFMGSSYEFGSYIAVVLADILSFLHDRDCKVSAVLVYGCGHLIRKQITCKE